MYRHIKSFSLLNQPECILFYDQRRLHFLQICTFSTNPTAHILYAAVELYRFGFSHFNIWKLQVCRWSNSLTHTSSCEYSFIWQCFVFHEAPGFPVWLQLCFGGVEPATVEPGSSWTACQLPQGGRFESLPRHRLNLLERERERERC